MGIEAIVFDIGEVLLKEDVIKARAMLCQNFNINPEKFKKFVIKNLPFSYSGELHYNEFFKKLIAEEKLKANYSNLVKAWLYARKKTSKINLQVKKLITNLSEEYTLVSFTNSTLLNDKVRKRLGVYNLFNINLISYEQRTTKKEMKFYQILTEKLKERGIQPQETLYIDNEQENLDKARKLGINTILYENNSQLKNDLKKLGIKLARK